MDNNVSVEDRLKVYELCKTHLGGHWSDVSADQLVIKRVTLVSICLYKITKFIYLNHLGVEYLINHFIVIYRVLTTNITKYLSDLLVIMLGKYIILY